LDYITGSKEYREEYFSDFKDWLEGEINQVLEDKTDTFNLQIEKEYNNGQQEE
jgi:DNA polymerase II small subunit/DNA polymerase delta subunit B